MERDRKKSSIDPQNPQSSNLNQNENDLIGFTHFFMLFAFCFIYFHKPHAQMA